MAEFVALKYRAFISYSHADTPWAKWLHKGLEGFTIDKELAGRETSAGTIPKTLKPIFRDRDDFTAGHTLTEQTLAALDASHALIVISSPAAAKSHYVNEEIRLFKSRHPERPVIPLIVAGKPGDGDNECFPPSLKFKVDAKGRIGKKRVELLAADAREEGDGKSLALAKVTAGLLGVSSDDIFRRAERERRRKARLRNGVIAALAILVVAASGSAAYAWQQLKTNEKFLSATLKRATDIVNTAVSQAETYGVPRKATLALLSQAEGLFDDMARLGRPTPELCYQKAWMLIEFARNYEILGDTNKSKERAEEAQQLFSGLAAEQPDDSRYRWSLAVAQVDLGDALSAQGRAADALQSYKGGLTIVDKLASADPNNLDYQRQVALSSDRVGGVLSSQGNLAEALKYYQSSLDIRQRMAMTRPDDWRLQSDYAASQQRLANLFMRQGDADVAWMFFNESRAIRERLAKAEPKNAGRQRDLGVAYMDVGDALLGDTIVTTGMLEKALETYRDGLAILEPVAKADPDNTTWQFDLALFQQRIGGVLSSQGDTAASRVSYEAAKDILERLVKSDPNNVAWQSALSSSNGHIGNLLLDQGRLPEALQIFRDGLAISERLGKSEPNNIHVQRNLAISHAQIATVLKKLEKPGEALSEFKAGRAITARLSKLSPDDAGVSRDLDHFDQEIADLQGSSTEGGTAEPRVEEAATQGGDGSPASAEPTESPEEHAALNQVPGQVSSPSKGPGAREGSPLAKDAEAALKAGHEFSECPGCPLMVVLPPGTYKMGASPDDPGAWRESERPQHDVTIAKPFAIGKYEVTFAEWEACVADGACPAILHSPGSDQLPVINVSWEDAQLYVSWLSKRTGKTYRLPAEAEWEYAARAGTKIWGLVVDKYAWFQGNSHPGPTHPVGQKLPNAFGLYDMYGNVWELVEDAWHDSLAGAPTDGSAWTKDGKGQFRVCRGGSWGVNRDFLRASSRIGLLETSRRDEFGFRVARTLSQ